MGKAKVSEIDRLIELASDEKPRQAVVTEMPHQNNRSFSLKDRKDSNPPMWKALLQLRVLLPYLSRLLPVLERSVLGTNILSGAAPVHPQLDATHIEEGFAGLEDANKDLAAQFKNHYAELKNQSLEIKSLQEQIGWLGKTIEKQEKRQDEIAESIASLRRLTLTWAIIGVVLLAALIAVVLLKPSFLR